MDQKAVMEAVDRLGSQVAIVMPSATFGLHQDMQLFNALVSEGVPVVLDAAPGLGSVNAVRHLGEGFRGLVVFSMHATKPFCIGEGGLVYSADQRLIRRIRQRGNFGFVAPNESTLQGMNSKLSEISAAVALATLSQFGQKLANRRTVHQWYLEDMKYHDVFARGWRVQAGSESVPQQFMSVLTPSWLTNREAVRHLAKEGIESRTYFSPACHQQDIFKQCDHTTLFVTEGLAERVVSLPLWEMLPKEAVTRVVTALIACASHS